MEYILLKYKGFIKKVPICTLSLVICFATCTEKKAIKAEFSAKAKEAIKAKIEDITKITVKEITNIEFTGDSITRPITYSYCEMFCSKYLSEFAEFNFELTKRAVYASQGRQSYNVKAIIGDTMVINKLITKIDDLLKNTEIHNHALDFIGYGNTKAGDYPVLKVKYVNSNNYINEIFIVKLKDDEYWELPKPVDMRELFQCRLKLGNILESKSIYNLYRELDLLEFI
jgi:hypothetical protein